MSHFPIHLYEYFMYQRAPRFIFQACSCQPRRTTMVIYEHLHWGPFARSLISPEYAQLFSNLAPSRCRDDMQLPIKNCVGSGLWIKPSIPDTSELIHVGHCVWQNFAGFFLPSDPLKQNQEIFFHRAREGQADPKYQSEGWILSFGMRADSAWKKVAKGSVGEHTG